MSDKRPIQLVQHNEGVTSNNDALIVAALVLMEKDVDGLELKATVATLCRLTGLSRNTIRSRGTALLRLKAIKTARRLKQASASSASVEPPHLKSVEEGLRAKVERVLAQNALLYDEILFLRSRLDTKEREIQTLKATKLKLV